MSPESAENQAESSDSNLFRSGEGICFEVGGMLALNRGGKIEWCLDVPGWLGNVDQHRIL